MGKLESRPAVAAMAAFLLVGIYETTSAAEPLGSGFSIQGQVKLGGAPLNDNADFEFTLYDAMMDGNQVGEVVAVNGLAVADGRSPSSSISAWTPSTARTAGWKWPTAHPPAAGISRPSHLVNR